MPPFYYKDFISSTMQTLTIVCAPIFLKIFQLMRKKKPSFCNCQRFNKFLYFIRMAELCVWKCLHYFTMFSSHPHGKAYRFYMPPFFYNFSSTFTRQSLDFVNAPIVLLCFHISVSRSIAFENAAILLQNFHLIRIAKLSVC